MGIPGVISYANDFRLAVKIEHNTISISGKSYSVLSSMVGALVRRNVYFLKKR